MALPLQRPVISPILEEIAGLRIPLTSESDMSVLTSERGLRASFLRVVRAGLQAAAPVVAPQPAADGAAAPASTLLLSMSENRAIY